MTPHKPISSLPPERQVNKIGKDVDKIKMTVASHAVILNSHTKQLSEITNYIKDLHKKFNNLDEKFNNLDGKLFKWKSEIHDLIDQGFTSRIKYYDEEIAALGIRELENREEIAKLKTYVHLDN